MTIFPRRHLLACLSLLVAVTPAAAQQPAPTPNPAVPPTPGTPAPQEPQEPVPLQEPQPPPVEPDETVIVTATRTAVPAFQAPYSTDIVTSEVVEARAYRTTPQSLRNIPGVMVQETSVGQGSPFIRGFTGQRTLFLIDGVRLNSSFFREGPNQYWNTVDPLSLDRIEVVKGPSSVLYGSDAIGGTAQGLTRSPYAWGDGFAYGGSAYLRAATAENSLTGRGEISLSHSAKSGARTGFLLGASLKHFEDFEGGGDVGEMENTGYEESDYDIKVEHWFNDHVRLVFLFQDVTQTDVPRTHRTVFAESWEGTAVGTDLQHDFDQRRRLTYLQLHAEELDGFVDTIRANVSWQDQQEELDRIRSNSQQEVQGFDVGTLGLWLQLGSETDIGNLTWGAEWYRDFVDSYLYRTVPQTGDDIQGPIADDSTYDLAGLYVQDEIEIVRWLTFTLGGRFNYAAVDADSVRDPSTGQQISISDDWSDFVGSARFSAEAIEDTLRFFGGVSQGFRAPNLSDLTRFDTARSGELEIPSPGLDPEEYLSYELGVKTQNEDFNSQLAVFYTDIDDQIVRFPTGTTAPTGEAEITKANVGDGYVWGVEVGAAYRLPVVPEMTLFGNATYIKGKVDNFETLGSAKSSEYFSKLMPPTVQLGLRWDQPEHNRFWAETIVVYADTADRLSSGDQADTQRIPPGGTPSYVTWEARGGWHIDDRADLMVGVENITDTDYRVHGSGQNSPGRNLVVGLSTRF